MILSMRYRLSLLALITALLTSLAGGQTARRDSSAAKIASADSSKPQSRTLGSWTSDRMRLGIGDIVTVLVDERTLASAILRDDNAEQRSKQLGLDAAPPGPAGAVARTTASVTFDSDGDSKRRGTAVRENGFRAEMSARVVAVSPNGTLQIKGRKMVTVDKNQQEIELSGWIRPQDIVGSTNTIESSRLADAQIAYAQKGGLGKPKSGILGRIVGIIWP